MNFTGNVWKFGDDIDTDLIIPARYLTTSDPKILDGALHGGCRSGFIARSRRATSWSPGRISAAAPRANMPRSRSSGRDCLRRCQELCPHLLQNAFNMGLPIFEAPTCGTRVSNGDRITVMRMRNGPGSRGTAGKRTVSSRFQPFMRELMNAGGLMQFLSNVSPEGCKMKSYRIAVLPGDGIARTSCGKPGKSWMPCRRGPTSASIWRGAGRRRRIRPLRNPASPTGHGPCAFERWPFCLGAVGGPQWNPLTTACGRSGAAGTAVCSRPLCESPSGGRLRGPDRRLAPQERGRPGIDLLFVRELLGNALFRKAAGRAGRKRPADRNQHDHLSETEIRRIAKTAFEIARQRGKKLLSWTRPTSSRRRSTGETSSSRRPGLPGCRPEPHVRGQLAMQLIRNPRQFDVTSRPTCSATSSATRRRC
jgi:3-isopropylmalate/(R)-2-methylmalate dehydratase small subunit